MKLAIFSDVHANLPALEAVLANIEGRKDLDGVYHLGDLVGYAPWPNETVTLIRNRGIQGVAGNYDSTVATNYDHCGCKADTLRDEELAHRSYGWTLGARLARDKAFLGQPTLPAGPPAARRA